MGWLCSPCRHSVGTSRGKWAHMQLIKEHPATVISAVWATVDWSWLKKWNRCAQADLKKKKRKKKRKESAGGEWDFLQTFPTVLTSDEKAIIIGKVLWWSKLIARHQKNQIHISPYIWCLTVTFWSGCAACTRRWQTRRRKKTEQKQMSKTAGRTGHESPVTDVQS